MRLCNRFDSEGNTYLFVGEDVEYYKGLVGTNTTTLKGQVPMRPNKGCNLDETLLMENNQAELLKLIIRGDLFPSFAENVPNVFLMDADYVVTSKDSGRVDIKYTTAHADIVEMSVKLR